MITVYFWLAVLLLVAMFSMAGCGDDAVTPQNQVIRSADPLGKSIEWTTGADALVTPELQNGNPAHNLSPAELIYYCAQENCINPVLVLALIENQDLLSQSDRVGDFELRLYRACNLETVSGKYGGFFPQLVASTFQLWLDRTNSMNFAESYQNNFTGRYTLTEFMAIYTNVSSQINQQTGLNYPTDPDPATSEILDDFRELTIEQIQAFLASRPNTALKRTTLFREPALTDSVSY